MGGPATSVLRLPGGTSPEARLRKLTTWEFTNSVQDLLGAGTPLGPVEVDSLVGGFATVGASTVALSPAGVGQYETALGNATQYVFADPTRVAAVFPCVPTSTTDACLTQAINAFGRRAFRRSLSQQETTRFVTLATTIGTQAGSNVLTGLRYVVWAILQSPSFLYRVELGQPSAADGGRLKYTSSEIASRLAAALWGSVPDDALLDAADKDLLSTPDGITAQAQRMIADARVHRAMAAFVDQLIEYQRLQQAAPDTSVFPMWTSTLRTAMLQEVELRVDDMVFNQKADFLTLFDGRSTFVNAELAKFYGLAFTATDNAFHPASFPANSPRAGLLGAGAILTGHALPQRTSPTARGKFVDVMLLCRTIPDPPPGVPPLPPPSDTTTTVRQKMEAHRSQPQCASCHALMDPMGFGMENFDATSQYRTTDNGHPIDATGTLDGVAFSNLADLGAVLRKSPTTGPCFVSKIYANALGRTPSNLDGAALDQLAGQFASSGNRADRLLVSLVTSDSFRFVQPK
jgi:hypothetical protein